jgi:uncharacterized protein (DUF427 family)
MATASWNGTVIASSDDVVELDGYTYFPLGAVVPGVLKESATTSVCTFKGTANYYTLEVGGALNPDAGWSYLDPSQAAGEIRGRVAFWKGTVVTP